MVLRLVERFGSLKAVTEAYEEFYDLDQDWASHLLAYENIREAEETVLSTGRL